MFSPSLPSINIPSCTTDDCALKRLHKLNSMLKNGPSESGKKANISTVMKVINDQLELYGLTPHADWKDADTMLLSVAAVVRCCVPCIAVQPVVFTVLHASLPT